MTEWWTYRLQNFLMFSPRTYHRMFELYNRDVWPLQLAAMAAGGVILFLLLGSRRNAGRAAGSILAILWLWIAWAFHLQRYRTIFPAAVWVAALFAIQAVALIALRNRLTVRRPASRIAGALFALAWLVQPLLGLIVGRPVVQMELFGIAPDPTVAATFAAVLAFDAGPRKWLLIVPCLWAALSGATLWAMDSPEALVLPAFAVVTIALSARRARPAPSR